MKVSLRAVWTCNAVMSVSMAASASAGQMQWKVAAIAALAIAIQSAGLSYLAWRGK